MNLVPDRWNTLFSLRYAVRVLERYARLWHRADVLLRLATVASGMSAVVALWSEWGSAAQWVTALFALLQAVEFVLGAPRREQEAQAARGAYARVLAREADMSDAELARAYAAVLADDTITVPESLRRLAYNDVVEEKGADLGARYAPTFWMKALGVLG